MPTTAATKTRWGRLPEAEAEVGGVVSQRTIRKWATAGKIRCSRPSRQVLLIDLDDLQRFLAEHAQPVPA